MVKPSNNPREMIVCHCQSMIVFFFGWVIMVIPASWMGFQAYCTYDKYIYIIYVYIYMIYIYIIFIYIIYIYIIYLYIISYIYIYHIYIYHIHTTQKQTHTHHFKPWLQQWGLSIPRSTHPDCASRFGLSDKKGAPRDPRFEGNFYSFYMGTMGI